MGQQYALKATMGDGSIAPKAAICTYTREIAGSTRRGISGVTVEAP
jgi:hypothetical protein